jgi:chromosome segregation ATPase
MMATITVQQAEDSAKEARSANLDLTFQVKTLNQQAEEAQGQYQASQRALKDVEAQLQQKARDEVLAQETLSSATDKIATLERDLKHANEELQALQKTHCEMREHDEQVCAHYSHQAASCFVLSRILTCAV